MQISEIRSQRSLTPADVALLTRIDASALADGDLTALAEMERDCTDESELRLVRSILTPQRRREIDLAHERAQLESELRQARNLPATHPARDGSAHIAIVGLLAPLLREEQHRQVEASGVDEALREQMRWSKDDALAAADK